MPLLRNPRIAELLVAQLARVRRTHGLELFAWVIMPEHVHLLCRPPGTRPLEPILRSAKMSVAKTVLPRWATLQAPILDRLRDNAGRPHFWTAGGGFDRNVRDSGEFSREVRYTHHNPVRRGLTAAPADYPFSSIHWWLGHRENQLECDPPPGPGWNEWKGFA